MQDIVAITKTLSDESRLRALLMLRHDELCVCQIIEMLCLAPSTVSKHMSILRQAIRWITESAVTSRQIELDDQKLHKVLTIDKEALCKRQMGK